MTMASIEMHLQMKKLVWISIALVFGLSGTSFSQSADSPTGKSFIIKTDVLVPIVELTIPTKATIIPLTFERYMHDGQSLQLTVCYIYKNTYVDDFQLHYGTFGKSRSFQITPEYKYFPGKKKNGSGFFFGTYVKYTFFHENSETYGDWAPYYHYVNYLQNSIAIGPNVGFQSYLWKHLVIELLFGAGYNLVINTQIIEEIDIVRDPGKSDGVDCRAAIHIGYKF